jgi:hypothetical protein
VKKTLRTLIEDFLQNSQLKNTAPVQPPMGDKPQAVDMVYIEGEPEDGASGYMYIGEMYAYGEPEDVPERCRHLVELFRKGGPDTPEYLAEASRVMGCSYEPDDDLEL